MVFTLSAILTPVYTSRAGFLSGFYYTYPCLGLSPLHLSALPDFWYRFISIPSALPCAPFYGCEIFAGQSLSHKAQGREQHPVFTTCKSTHPFPILSCLVDLLCPVCLSLPPCAVWCFSDLELGRLRNVILVLAADWSLGRAAYTDANRLEVLIIWGTLSSSKANKPLFFSLSLSSYCATLPCKNKARISLQKYLPCFIKIQQGPSLFLNIPSFYTIPKHSSPGQRWEVTWGEVTRGTKCHGDDDPVQAGQSLGFGISSPHPSLPCLTPLCSTEYLEIRLLSQGWEQHPGLDRYFGSIVLKVLTKGFCTRHSRQMQNPIWNKRDEKDFHSPSRI